MSKDLYIQRLRAVPLFSGLAKRELDLIVRQADHLRYPARYRVVREGTPGEEFWMVIEGELAVTRGGVQVATLGPGDYFGELAVIDPAPRDASVVATTPVELMVVGRRRFWATIEASPALMRKLMWGRARRLHEADRREVDLRKAGSLTDA
jgi:CRP/FNR family transcriptional regulator, cyclic AMP receptor protein